jgi:colicin import membrane protein
MARKLKVFETSLGFFDLAIAAPSMKAALEAWGADSNLFHQGAARESTDQAVVAAAMAKPGVILRRPVGSDGPFTEHADVPTGLPGIGAGQKPHKSKSKPKKQPPARPSDDKAARKAALAFERVQKQRERERQREEAAEEKRRERRRQAVAKAEAALDQAKREHESRAAIIEAERAALDEKSQAEDARWENERKKLESALRQARD